MRTGIWVPDCLHRRQITQSTRFICATAWPLARRCSTMILFAGWCRCRWVMHQPGTTAWTSAHRPPQIIVAEARGDPEMLDVIFVYAFRMIDNRRLNILAAPLLPPPSERPGAQARAYPDPPRGGTLTCSSRKYADLVLSAYQTAEARCRLPMPAAQVRIALICQEFVDRVGKGLGLIGDDEMAATSIRFSVTVLMP